MPHKMLTVDADSAGSRLDLYLAKRFGPEGVSRAEAQRLISEGLVRVNGRGGKAASRLKTNDIVSLERIPVRDTAVRPESVPLEVVYEDANCIVINKTAGMMVHPATGTATGTLVNALLHHCPDLVGIGGERRPGIVHRLDKDTSGLVVVAKTPLAFQHLARQFKDRRIQKEYVALVWGKLPRASGMIDRPIGRHRSDRKRMSSRYSLAKSRQAVTEWQLEKLFKLSVGPALPLWVSLLRLKPKTGRTHQLRVHLADLGFPIVGDKIYGSKRRGPERKNTAASLLDVFPRQALHAERLMFVHPANEKLMVFRAPLPPDMKQLLEFLAERAER
jgi:23S rRNA pseudouridine1911/1915/1917 synthase